MRLDLAGEFLRRGPDFRGKGRLHAAWLRRRQAEDVRLRRLPGGALVACDVSIPYEAQIWMGREEPRELEALVRLLRPGDTFVDCGANLGLWTLVASRAVGDVGRVVAIEPHPATARKLRENLARSNCANVRVVEAAVGQESGTVELTVEDQHNCNRIEPVPTGTTIPVRLVTLDDELGAETVAGCKVDVEGFELEVLAGARVLLERHRPWLCVEFNTLLAGTRRLEEWPVHRMLGELGYEPATALEVLSGETSHATLAPARDGYVNLFYLPTSS